MREAAGLRGPVAPLRAVLGVVAAAVLLTSCTGGAAEPASAPAETSGTTSSPTDEATVSPSPVTSPSPDKPEKPRFRASGKGKREYVSYIVDGWAYGLQTNDASVLLKASGREPCRGCRPFQRELKQRDKEGWYVQFPGAKVRKVTFRRDGEVEVATAVVDIPESQSFFDDGTFRNDNRARRGKKFLIDIRAVGQGDKRRWTLVAFSLK